ncbi:hypothetical protein [Bombella sp. ESL0385]|uniref:hypothetical protein n=1 Tax=Bombella sp. ESL0385 TaxID=2676446 RepID=UPI0012D8E04D|nr:hypothetical protein [Bombella sp. ESL0385]MUG90113.1 hypothetical protein [Bombella sp. ESL0385]
MATPNITRPEQPSQHSSAQTSPSGNLLLLESKYAPQNWLPSPNQPDSLTNQSHQLIGKAPWDGLWLPIAIQHEVSTEMQEGKWHTTIDCIRTNLGQKPPHNGAT